MAAKKDFSADALDAFDIELPRRPSPVKEDKPQEKAKPKEKETSIPLFTAKPANPTDSEINVKMNDSELFRRTFYITHAQHKALKIRAAESERPEDKDTSAIIRAAIDLYLSQK